MKTVLVLFLGFVIFKAPVSLKNIGGMSLAVVGMVLYSWAVEKGKKEREEASKAKNKLLEGDGNLNGAGGEKEEEKVGLLDKEQGLKTVDK